MLYYFIAALFFFIPVAAIAFFILSLYRFLSVKKQNKLKPGSVDNQVLKTRKTTMAISSVVMGVLVMVLVGLIILLIMSIVYM